MILQLPPKDEEEPLITDKEMEGLGGTGGKPETAEMAEFNDAVTRYRRSQPVYTQPEGTTATAPAPQPAQTSPPRLRGRDKRDGNAAVKTPAQAEIPDNEKGNTVLTSYNVGENIESFMKNTWINTAGLSLISGKPEDVQEWVAKHEDEVRMVLQEAIDKMAERGILRKAQPSPGQVAGSISKNSGVLQSVPVSLPGGVEGEPEPTPEPGVEIPKTPEEAWESPEVNKDWDSIKRSTMPHEEQNAQSQTNAIDASELEWQKFQQNPFPEEGFWEPSVQPDELDELIKYGGINNIPQYTDLKEILGAGYGEHYNLCGVYDVAQATGLDGEDAILLLSKIQDGEKILKNNQPINEYKIAELYNAAGWEAYVTGMYESDQLHWDEDENEIEAKPTPEKLAEYLDQEYVISALVNIEGNYEDDENRGLVVSSDAPDVQEPTNHYVNVLAVLENEQGDQFVRVYNPYNNREEVYAWARFSSAWDNYDTTGRFRAILSKPDSGG